MEKISPAVRQGKNFFRLLIASFFICTLFFGCNIPNLNSDWRTRQITIDGKYSDWPGTETYYDEKESLSINLLNDQEYLYLCLITRNRELEIQLMESGLVAWFDPQGAEKRLFGISFPIGLSRMGISLEEDKQNEEKDWQDQEDKSGLIDKEKQRWRDKDFNKHLETMEGLQDRLELLIGTFDFEGKEKKQAEKEWQKMEERKEFFKDKIKEFSLEEAGKLGIEVKVGRENNYFVYELKVPLVKTDAHPFAIGAKAGATIGLGLENTGLSGVDFPGEDGGHGHGMHSKDGFQFWAKVTLSQR